MWQDPQGRSSLDSLAPVSRYDQMPAPCNSSPAIVPPPPGKTTFLGFMLVRLISARQVVLFCNGNTTYLFYCGNVYSRPIDSGFRNLPGHPNLHPIWALINVDYKDRGPPISGGTNVWPIQASSPNPVRWNLWLRRNGGALLGFPKWSVKELAEGYVLSLSPLSTVGPGRIVQ